ncbi:uncharacterized protein LOC114163309 [Vigna unguiculata]|uniref:uncharacterized protein LOC114163309 n=1 Tax=Vigna unguiculata TaxID=3917 RepID=UPI0010166748|nr:uncharacterized protein LOC114163309 [Vigna unguiculata]
MESKHDFVNRTLEYILHRVPDTEINGNMLKNSLRIGQVFGLEPRNKKTVFLKILQHYLSTHSITEPLLYTLELLAELFCCDASPVPATMTAAYCAVAVECTLKYLKLSRHHHNPLYLDAVNRIWRVRIALMNSSGSGKESVLLSGELEQWRKDIETSLLDSEVMERLASIDTKRDAMVKVKAFLDEARTDLEPGSLKCSSVAADNDNQTSVFENCDQGPCSVETNIIAGVNESGKSISGELLVKESLPITLITESSDRRFILVDKSTTADVYEWDESIDGLEGGTSNRASRFNLPSPKRRNLSPLKKYEPKETKMRRKARRWNQLEEATLREGVVKFGKGNWKLILNSEKDIFAGRTEVDLKDKWRNMSRRKHE